MLFIPNVPNKVVLLVDDLTENKKMAITTDPNKFDYNISHLDKDLKTNIEMRLPLVEEKMVTITALGRYILIFELEKENKKRSMIFFDFEQDKPVEAIAASLSKQFSHNIASEFIRLQRHMESQYTTEHDIIHLHYLGEKLQDIHMN